MTIWNIKFTYHRLGQVLRVIGWGGLALFLSVNFVPRLLANGAAGLSDRELGMLLGVAPGLLFGYFIGAGKAIVINFDKNDKIAD